MPLNLDDNERIALAREEMRSPTINLRREEFAYTRDIEKTKRYFKTTAVPCDAHRFCRFRRFVVSDYYDKK